MVLRAVSFGMLNQAMTTWFGIHCTLRVSPWRHVLVGQLHHGDQGGRGCHPKDVEDWKWICTRPESCVWQYEHWKWMKSNELNDFFNSDRHFYFERLALRLDPRPSQHFRCPGTSVSLQLHVSRWKESCKYIDRENARGNKKRSFGCLAFSTSRMLGDVLMYNDV